MYRSGVGPSPSRDTLQDSLWPKQQKALIEAYHTHGSRFEIKELLEDLVRLDKAFRERVDGHVDALVADGKGPKAKSLKNALKKPQSMLSGPQQRLARSQTIAHVVQALRDVEECGTESMPSSSGASEQQALEAASHSGRTQATTQRIQQRASSAQSHGQQRRPSPTLQPLGKSPFETKSDRVSDRPLQNRQELSGLVASAQSRGGSLPKTRPAQMPDMSFIVGKRRVASASQTRQPQDQPTAHGTTTRALLLPVMRNDVPEASKAGRKQLSGARPAESQNSGVPSNASSQVLGIRTGSVPICPRREQMEALV